MAATPTWTGGLVVGSINTGIVADTGYGGVTNGGYTAVQPATAVTIVDGTVQTVASVTTTTGSKLATVASGGFPKVFNSMSVLGTVIAEGTVVQMAPGTGAQTLILSLPATASGTVTLTFVPNGIRVEELNLIPLGTVAAGEVNIFLYDGTSYWLRDQFSLPAATLSQSQPQLILPKTYANLEIPTGWKLSATVTTTQTAPVNITATGGSY
jgi:hypothetical protein